jgi:hypothetical protein
MYSAEEKAVLDYLGTSPAAFFSGREVCRRAGTKEMWEKNQRWAIPVLSRLVSRGVVETDAAGHYRLAPQDAAGT